MHLTLNLKVLRDMDNDMLRLTNAVQASVKDVEKRSKLLAEIQKKREAICLLYDHYEAVVNGKKTSSSRSE
jgi:hypothetical protein